MVIGMAAGVEPRLRCSAPSAGKVLGLTAAAGGAAFVVWAGGSGGSASPNAPLGALFLILQLSLGASYPVAQKPLLGRYPPIVVAAWGYVAGLSLLSLSTATAATKAADWAFSTEALGAVAFAGLGASAFAYGAMAVANSLCGPLVLTAFFPLLPLTTALCAWLGDGTVPLATQAGGAGIIALGLCIVLAAKAVEESHTKSLGADEEGEGDAEDLRGLLLNADSE